MAHYCLVLRRKMRKIAILAYFSPKMPICRNFCGRKCGLWVRGGRNFFGPHQIYSKVFPKKFSWTPPHFGALQPAKSRKTPVFGQKWPKIEKFSFFLAEISACGCPARPKKFFRIQNLPKYLQNFFDSLTQF